MAAEWFHRFEGAGLDGVIAKHESTTYQPGKRAMVKVKHARTADCVVAGFRWHKQGPGTLVGSLLLGPLRRRGRAASRGRDLVVHDGRRARSLAQELEPLRKDALAAHPWRDWAEMSEGGPAHARRARAAGARARTSRGSRCASSASCEVKYDHLQGDRFRHAAVFLRWRPDKPPADCRYDQLEVTPPAELAEVFRPAA